MLPSWVTGCTWAPWDAHLVALDAKTGNLIWDAEVADETTGYSITGAPLLVGDKILTGIAGGEFGIRGFIDAYEASTGELAWRVYTIPGPDHPDNASWAGNSWRTGGSPSWVTGSYDPELNLVYWGTGNPGPDWNGDVRMGDNLYSDAVLAINPDTGGDGVVFPVHSARRPRLGRHPDSDPGRFRVRRAAAPS